MMNKILTELKKIMTDSIKEYLPEVSFDLLEDNGAVFYMNGKNGTEFDWFVNDKISDFNHDFNSKRFSFLYKFFLLPVVINSTSLSKFHNSIEKCVNNFPSTTPSYNSGVSE